MYHAYRIIFWGIFFATFHINLSIFQILPVFVGWTIVAVGTAKAADRLKTEAFKRAAAFARLLVVLSVLSGVLTLYQSGRINDNLRMIAFIVTTLFCIFELLTEFKIMEASINELISGGYQEEADHDVMNLRVYTSLFLINTILMCVGQLLVSHLLITMTALLGILLRISMLVMVSSYKKRYPEIEEDQIEPG